jgi:diguanylate cyclase (GGDEF)-like protein
MFNELYNRTILNILWQNNRKNAGNDVIMLDCDHFKEVNDKCGHDRGDDALKIYKDSILRAIDSMSSLKDRTFPARWGGDEFLVCVYNSSGGEVIELAKK